MKSEVAVFLILFDFTAPATWIAHASFLGNLATTDGAAVWVTDGADAMVASVREVGTRPLHASAVLDALIEALRTP